MIVVGIILGFFVAVMAFLTPKWAFYLFWPVTWCYPTSLLYGALPFNIRFDDLFMVWLTIACLRVLPPDVLPSRSFRVALIWFLSITFGAMAGLLTSESYAIRAILRDIAKAMHVPMVALTTCALIRSERDTRSLLVVMALGAAGSFAIGVLQVYRPDLTAFWEIPQTELGMDTESERHIEGGDTQIRAQGAVGGITLSILGFSMALLGLRLALHDAGTMRKLGHSINGLAGLVGLGYTVTRGAMAGLAGALFFSLFTQSKKGAALILIFAGAAITVSQTDVLERMTYRVASKDSDLGSLEAGAAVRGQVWMTYLTEWSPHYFLFGRGFTAELVRHQCTAHNTYIGALAYTGLFGVVALIWVVFMMMHTPLKLLRIEKDPFYLGLTEAFAAMVVAFMVNGLTAELWQQPQPIIFSLYALVDARLRLHETAATAMTALPSAWTPVHAGARRLPPPRPIRTVRVTLR